MRERQGRSKQMRREWQIEDVIAVCRSCALDCRRPSGASCHVVWHPMRAELLTIPFNRPIKPIYMKLLVGLIKAAEDEIDGGPRVSGDLEAPL
jgi:hypothetical protein